MIKDIQTVSNSYAFKDIKVFEKLDMFYFKVMISNNNYTILSHNHKLITESDMIINSMWYDINNFVKDNIYNKCSEIYNKYGNVIIGFFYCPCEKPLHIKYNNFLNNNLSNNKFIISSVKTIHKHDINIQEFCVNNRLLNIRGIGGGPIISTDNNFIDYLNKYAHKEISKQTFINYCNNIKTFSGNAFNDIEGLIINDNGNLYQIIINDSNDTKIYNRTDYDYLIKDFIEKFDKLDILYSYNDNVNTAYLNTVCDIFLKYVEMSDVINYIDNEKNLLPPGEQYISDISYNLINNHNIETICKLSNIHKNIFRILYKGLKRHRKTTIYSTLSNDDIDKWNNIVDKISKKIRGN